MAYIRYINNPNGAVYASVVEGVRTRNKVTQRFIANLDRVIDREKGIYKNRERGVYQYSLDSGYSQIPEEFAPAGTADPQKEKLILDFGDSYVLEKYLRTLPFYGAVCSAMAPEADTLLSLLFYRILIDRKAYCYARSWWEGNYAALLFPEARLHSQRVREFLAALGKEEVQRSFFTGYLTAIYGKEPAASGILIDSTGPKDINAVYKLLGIECPSTIERDN